MKRRVEAQNETIFFSVNRSILCRLIINNFVPTNPRYIDSFVSAGCIYITNLISLKFTLTSTIHIITRTYFITSLFMDFYWLHKHFENIPNNSKYIA